jgi:DNA recombination protein RmuC
MAEIIGIVIIALLVVLLLFLLWDRLHGRQRLKEQGDALSKIVGEKVEGSMAVFGDVRERLGELTQRARDIQEVGKNVSSLQELLRAPKFRGGFGELLLERLLADILPADSCSRQYGFKGGQIVDAVVRIGNKLVPIDAKFPTGDFEQITKAESEGEQKVLRNQFIRNIKKHIDEVAKYILPDENTFDFALMYIPAENIYYETIVRGLGEDDILSYSLDRRVVPVSPNSFYAYLQVIVQGLRGLQFEKAAGEILSYVRRLQGDLNSFEDDFDKLGGHIRHAANKYDEASRKLTRFEDKLQLTGGVSTDKLPEGESKTPEDEG